MLLLLKLSKILLEINFEFITLSFENTHFVLLRI